ncbi:sugar phosphate nucleotidyltransferase [[Clostridium] hylemonae]|uniref:Nucleotidyl transferase domain-containing protein n=1 Tax=[Clostridium] hylemonae DSM 15053 TaxID=553973 RepID=C0C2B8_9FIRM|nr:sugar phosphate nucleotidyltransferase [[Clostridium] hylemonae]EEG73542.1 hypothetical protein CLOHYLEM_06224 [[Clostridium] hylemonae DSM 15053]QEK17143.1 hypothetical protein LAJLEIBI_01152 [[Clostridium] hylemonae DSM 15053]
MGKATLVIMAAGIGSRFGDGIKQLESVGPNGEIIMDYSIYDALQAGFDKVVFIIRSDIEQDFKEIIGKRIEKKVRVEYAYQEVGDIPEKYEMKFRGRTKPWGTGQAVLCCKEIVSEPFLVINADDYYGKEAYKKAYSYLTQYQNRSDILSICMIGFILKNTLSENGGVTRGICRVNSDGMLTDIVETYNIVKRSDEAWIKGGLHPIAINVESEVSMNMWGLKPEFFDILEKEFLSFLDKAEVLDMKTEYLLPTIIGNLIKDEKIKVKVLQSQDKWFGVTYKEDKEMVASEISELVNKGVYPNCLVEQNN